MGLVKNAAVICAVVSTPCRSSQSTMMRSRSVSRDWIARMSSEAGRRPDAAG
jgi:hypothetical protein